MCPGLIDKAVVTYVRVLKFSRKHSMRSTTCVSLTKETSVHLYAVRTGCTVYKQMRASLSFRVTLSRIEGRRRAAVQDLARATATGQET